MFSLETFSNDYILLRSTFIIYFYIRNQLFIPFPELAQFKKMYGRKLIFSCKIPCKSHEINSSFPRVKTRPRPVFKSSTFTLSTRVLSRDIHV